MNRFRIVAFEEPNELLDVSVHATDDEVLHILLRKLYMSDSDEYLFDAPSGFWNDERIKRIVRLMTIENDLAYITANRDYERIYLKISRNGIDISKKGGWLNCINSL